MSMEYIRQTYGVPAKRGGRIEYTGNSRSQQGTIVGAHAANLWVRIDGNKRTGVYHPTWEMRYLDTEPAQREGE